MRPDTRSSSDRQVTNSFARTCDVTFRDPPSYAFSASERPYDSITLSALDRASDVAEWSESDRDLLRSARLMN
jgi:hypothetical protein